MSGTVAEPKPAEELPVLIKRLLGNAGLLLGGRAANAVMGLGYMGLAGRGLGAANLGVLVLIHAFAQLVGDVMKFQSWQSVLQFGAHPLADGRRRDFQRTLRFTLALDSFSVAAGLVVGVAGALLFAGRLGWGHAHAPAAAAYMIVIVAMVATTPVGLMRLFNRFDVLAKQTALVSFLRLAGSGTAFLLHAPMEGFLLAWAVGQLLGFAYLIRAATQELKARDLLDGFAWRDGALTQGMPGAWKFAWNTNISSTLDTGLTQVATLGVGALLGPSAAAFWKVGRQIADAIAKPARLLGPALYPELARLRAARSEAMMLKLSSRVGMMAGGFASVLLLASLFAGPLILKLVMGKTFAPAAGVMTWQVAAATVAVFAVPLEPMLISLGRAGAVVTVQAGVCLFYMATLYLAAPRLGLTGAGAGLLAAEIGLALGLLYFVRRARRAFTPDAAPATPELAAEPIAA